MKLLRIALVVAGSTLGGLAVWRTVEKSRLENDLWAEAERADATAAERTLTASTERTPTS
ncbi:hypothetical protein JSY14_07320 [Brachybacterium sp. EF45031]|uniref:DLW-39 family protein n=1 Tax=Brachybacterium sillae TaxID=2810536 RepID=UPI00217EAB27|nr:DLW-39 family protein [Brachybacterium sillae]MCS6711839.1 hypothetical protein [Brachybacterium sillae]